MVAGAGLEPTLSEEDSDGLPLPYPAKSKIFRDPQLLIIGIDLSRIKFS